MNHQEFLELVVCPISKEKLCLHSFEVFEEKKVKFGVLMSKNGYAYPIINFIPRIFEGAWLFYKDKLNSFQSQINKLKINEKLNIPSDDFKKNVLPTLKRFEKEWEKHKISDKTWGWSQSERIEKYREYMQLFDENYNGKLFLDVGAGTGQLTVTLSKKLKGTFIGIDLTPGIEKGNELAQKNKDVNCFFIQASLMQMPFKEKTFDYIHASGVLHHTPDTKYSFNMVEKNLKVKGKFGVWLYRYGSGDISLPLVPFTKLIMDASILRKYTTKMNPTLLYKLIYTYSLIFHVFYKLNELLRKVKHAQTIKERVTSIFDALAPKYAHKHKVEEVKNWFKEKNYSNLIETDQNNKSGFNIVGTKN